MLELDVGSLSQAELREAVSCHCAQFGTVMNIDIRTATWGRDYGIAAVEMSKAVEAKSVLDRIGDARDGCTVIIRLAAGERPIPVSLRRNAAMSWAQRSDCYLTRPLAVAELVRAANDPANARV